MSNLTRNLIYVIVLGLLVGCGQARIVKREWPDDHRQRSADVHRARSVSVPEHYRVIKGDTLYGIAFRHQLDFRDIAGWNGIRPPYTIYPGQLLKLNGRRSVVRTPPSVVAPRQPATSAPEPIADSRPPVNSSSPVVTAPRPVASTPSPSPPRSAATSTAPPASNGGPVHTSTPQIVVTQDTTPEKPAPSPPVRSGAIVWAWPTDGRVISRFVANDPTRQGIAIDGKQGQPVRAAADGVVVYSGTGLVGYGELIIVKHDDQWLSAYGHNRIRLAKEGETVRVGQQIAELGRSGISRDMLHFEVRSHGKPVDPLQKLPTR